MTLPASRLCDNHAAHTHIFIRPDKVKTKRKKKYLCVPYSISPCISKGYCNKCIWSNKARCNYSLQLFWTFYSHMDLPTYISRKGCLIFFKAKGQIKPYADWHFWSKNVCFKGMPLLLPVWHVDICSVPHSRESSLQTPLQGHTSETRYGSPIP